MQNPSRRLRLPRIGLRHRVKLVLLMLIASTVGAYGAAQIYQEYAVMKSFLGDSSYGIAACIGHSCSTCLESDEPSMLQQTVVAARTQHPDVTYVVVQDRLGLVLASTEAEIVGTTLNDVVSRRAGAVEGPNRQEIEGEPLPLYRDSLFDVSMPLRTIGGQDAVIRVGISSKTVSNRIRQGVRSALGIFLLALAFGAALAFLVDRRLGRSLSDLTAAARKMAAGDLSTHTRIDTGDELQILGESLNQMASDLSAAQQEVRRWTQTLEKRVRSRTRDLEGERQKLDGILRSIGAGLVMLDRQRTVLWSNASLPAGVPGQPKPPDGPCHRVIWNEEDPCADCASARAFRTGTIEHCEKRTSGSNGNGRTFLISASPIRDESGVIVRVVELIQDVTALRQMEAQLVQAGKMSVVGELAAGIAHELNNPLAIIGAHAERMQRLIAVESVSESTLEKFPSYLNVTVGCVARCKATVTRLLNFARRKEAQLRPTDVRAAVAEAVSLAEHQAAVERKRIVMCIADGLPPIETDPGGLEQICLNLISNALDAIPEGEQVRVEAGTDGPDVVVSVIDKGVGIPTAEMDRLFQPFYTTKAPGKGTGLGLAICSRLVRQLGGQIGVHSEAGEGTTFTVRLPIQGAARAADV